MGRHGSVSIGAAPGSLPMFSPPTPTLAFLSFALKTLYSLGPVSDPCGPQFALEVAMSGIS